MIWQYFPLFFSVIALCWFISAVCLLGDREKLITWFTWAGIFVLGTFITVLWITLERPPLKTLAETRLWYSWLLPVTGILLYRRWKYRWILNYCLGLAFLFLVLTLSSPDTFDQTLMPALQSPWFIPHVIVYMVAYALLAASSLVGMKGLKIFYRTGTSGNTLALADNLVFLGSSFLLFGLLLGAIWAKEAWGHYWTWDPKETWAYLSWFAYLLYIHWRIARPRQVRAALWILSLAFVVLLICWMGMQYLPAAGNSIHSY